MRKKILIVNLNWMGDILFSTPAIRAVRKSFPKSHIACITHARCKNLLIDNPHLDEVLTFSPIFFLQLVKRKFDCALFFHPSRTKAFWVKLAGIPERLGFAGPKNKNLLTHAVPMPPEAMHKTDLLLHLLKECGIPADGRQTELFLSEDAPEKFRNFLREHSITHGEPYVVIHAGGNWDLKRWPAAYFIQWIKIFLRKYDYKVILCGTASETNLIDEIQLGVTDKRVISLCGKTSVEVLALLMKHARLVVSNDSGPIHVAASQGAKILGLFGPTKPELTGPILTSPGAILRKDTGCEVPCYFKSCDYRVCMDWLKPEEVFERADELLKT